ncbi:hypothetical protein GM160_08770 [Guyparkeria halophila]|uniref:Uncharacterized protein n=1 Tax=Guyparkeria halophila TaxID=47960 RepID=A0A6I6CX48_9GAMM|nr:hypothetical protein [Guyparkeria halophila]QGT78976.1 hypothetical protein GM160_08770 [Guyparkeria halophila]
MTNREILTSDAIKFALDWLEQNKVEIEPLKTALAERMAHWEHAQGVPKLQREAIIQTAASRAVRQHIEKLKSRTSWWQRA